MSTIQILWLYPDWCLGRLLQFGENCWLLWAKNTLLKSLPELNRHWVRIWVNIYSNSSVVQACDILWLGCPGDCSLSQQNPAAGDMAWSEPRRCAMRRFVGSVWEIGMPIIQPHMRISLWSANRWVDICSFAVFLHGELPQHSWFILIGAAFAKL